LDVVCDVVCSFCFRMGRGEVHGHQWVRFCLRTSFVSLYLRHSGLCFEISPHPVLYQNGLKFLFSQAKTKKSATGWRSRFSAFGASSQDSNAEQFSNNIDDLPWHVSHDDNFYSVNDSFGPEKSMLNEYAMEFLRQQSTTDGDSTDRLNDESYAYVSSEKFQQQQQRYIQSPQYTHLIAIPMEKCYELMLEMESVQRAILYHCPTLIHACIVPAVTRLPLLYVDATTRHRNSLTNELVSSSFLLNDQSSSDILLRLVREVMHDVLASNSTAHTLYNSTSAAVESHTHTHHPLTLTFATLEIDGPRNEVLSTVARPNDANTILLTNMVTALQHRIHRETGWVTMMPSDETQQRNMTRMRQDMDDFMFRPRIPFMRLPDTWDAIIQAEAQKNNEEEHSESKNIECDKLSTRDEAEVFLRSDQGANGISPIFWCQWWDDIFATARLTEIGVYTNCLGSSNDVPLSSSTKSLKDDITRNQHQQNEVAFRLPLQTVPLPSADPETAKIEAQFEKYHTNRLKQAEKSNRDAEQNMFSDYPEDDEMIRIKAQTLLESTRPDSGRYDFDDSLGLKQLDESNVQAQRRTQPRLRSNVEDCFISLRQKGLGNQSKKVDIASNPIFQKYKNGTLIPAMNTSNVEHEVTETLRPKKNRYVGFWRMIKTPTGFAVEEGDINRSDNLVLRVDGTTAGGPILDQETRQKAAGGTWRIEHNSNTKVDILVIRLIIPPKKERILVLEGAVEDISWSVLNSEEITNSMHCNGNVWIEDAAKALNKDYVGTFAITKLSESMNTQGYSLSLPAQVF
jgi:hypothetical protein